MNYQKYSKTGFLKYSLVISMIFVLLFLVNAQTLETSSNNTSFIKNASVSTENETNITSENNSQPSTQTNQNIDSFGNKIYTIVEMRPLFPGGDDKLADFIKKNLKFPVTAKKNKIQGKVIVRFVVNSVGKVEQSKVIRSLDPECDKEALRVINSLPVFIPGKQEGQNVSVYYIIPVIFK